MLKWEELVARRRRQLGQSPRVALNTVTPSFRSLPQALDRQRRSVERVPLLSAARPDLLALCQALDAAEVGALALSIEAPAEELQAFAAVSLAVTVPLLRADLILEEAQVYESRAAGADGVILHAALLPGALLVRLCDAARATHMAACVACASAAEVALAGQARAAMIAVPSSARALLAALPARTLALVLPDRFLEGGRQAPEAAALRGLADALLDPALGEAVDPAAEFRRLLEE